MFTTWLFIVSPNEPAAWYIVHGFFKSVKYRDIQLVYIENKVSHILKDGINKWQSVSYW